MTDESETACVYAIGNGVDRIKIGMSRDPADRLKYLSTASSYHLTLLFSKRYPSRLHARTVEKRMHYLLRKNRHAGEWFSVDLPTVENAIEIAERLDDDIAQSDRVESKDFGLWVKHMTNAHNWSKRECAKRLGCGINQIKSWSENGAPPYIGLACAALVFGLPAWSFKRSNE